jgi:exodeoxyribonuclease VII small subunit
MLPNIAELSFKEAMRELESIVRDLETGKAKLDDAVRAYERGAALKAHCEAKLAAAQAKIEQITVGPDGRISTARFGTDALNRTNARQQLVLAERFGEIANHTGLQSALARIRSP